MKLGIGSYAYMWSIGFAGAEPETPLRAIDLLGKARGMGVRVVQFGPNLPLEALGRTELDEVLSASRQWGIELELGTRGLETGHLVRMTEFAAECGAALLRTVAEIGGRVPSVPEVKESLLAIEPYLERAGVCLAVENNQMPAAAMRAALAGSAHAGVTLDTVNSLAIPEGTKEVARTLARLTRCLHVKDFAIRREWHMMGFRVEGRPAGQGQLEIPWLLELLEAEGASCNAILELWPPQQTTLRETIALEQRWAEESVTYLRTLIEG